MIVTGTGTPTRTLPLDGAERTWRCLARRGMLHSECESFDHVVLAPGQRRDFDTEGVEHAVLLLAGGAALAGPEAPRPLGAGDLALVPGTADASVVAGENGAEALVLSVLSEAARLLLPARIPEIPPGRRSIGVPADAGAEVG
ncbi:hypothetical protein [Streptomyces sp. PT12]|uniref:hypothetical protein n=1 Tax=Streptomyces sp. PT12 TaxID=1510197 RepID=UPI000DE232FC|nr:hypothetical protein [Streptomyces sp. PT12]RBM06240.1 hypothetical protein DEH69_26600 [Streptomyces sp. PT12]